MKKQRSDGVRRFYFWVVIALILLFMFFGLFIYYNNEKDVPDEGSYLSRLRNNDSELDDEIAIKSDEDKINDMNRAAFYGRSGLRASGPISSIGVLRIISVVHYNFTSGSLRIIHRDGAQENFDPLDSRYYPMFTPEGVASKIVSVVGVDELEIDSRPLNSSSTYYIQLSMISASGNPLSISDSYNRLRFDFPRHDMGYVFHGKEIFIQQYNPANLSESFQEYNVRELVAQNLMIDLVNINGTIQSEEPYAYFKLMFR
jgi:hypothetical protein